METERDFIFLGFKITADGDNSHKIKRCLLLGRKAMTNLDSLLKSRDITLLTKVCIVKAMIFPVVVYRCESWTIKKAECQRINAFELWCWRTLESPLDCKEIQSVSPKGNQSWIVIGRADVEAEAPVLWPPDAKNWLNGKDPDAGKDWRQEEKQTTEDETKLNSYDCFALTRRQWLLDKIENQWLEVVPRKNDSTPVTVQMLVFGRKI